MNMFLGLGVLLIFSSLASAAVVSDCADIDENFSKQAMEGKETLLLELSKKIKTDPGFVTFVDLPDLKICVRYSDEYTYTWHTTVYKIKCDPRSNCKCDHKKENKIVEHKNCSAYWRTHLRGAAGTKFYLDKLHCE